MIKRLSMVLMLMAPMSFVAACAGTGRPEPGARDARGSRIWAGTCNRCHNLRPPRQYTAQEWPVIVYHMRTRADLTRSEAAAVAAYLRRAAER